MSTVDDRSDWAEGCVTEIPYTRGFYTEMDPLRFGFAALAAGVNPPPVDQPFTYFELGCGYGFSTNIMAAANPHGRFFANDFNPSHVVSARSLAVQAGLTNVTFFEESFDELAGLDLPELDYVALHGIYSWISARNRRLIVDFIRRRLKPGGMVYVSYNSLPGSAQTEPLRRLLTEHASRQTEPLGRRIGGAIDFATRLKEAGAGFFVGSPHASRHLDRIKSDRLNYLAHEYFNQDWSLFHHADVAGEMGVAKLRFVCSATIIETIERFVLKPKIREIYRQIADLGLREIVKDYAINQNFRRDVFAKGAPRLRPPARRLLLESQRIALIRPRGDCPLEFQGPAGKVHLENEGYGPILDALAAGPKTLGELLAAPEVKAVELEDILDSVTVLIGAGYANPALPADKEDARRMRTDAFNGVVLDEAMLGEEVRALASPVLNSGLGVSLIDQMFLRGIEEREDDLATFAWKHLSANRIRIVKDGEPLEGEEACLAELRRRADAFVAAQLPLLRQLGVAPPSTERDKTWAGATVQTARAATA